MDSHLTETSVSTERIFEGRILNLRVDTVRMPDGATATREVVEHAPAVVIFPLLTTGEAVLIRQYRRPIDQIIFEFPAGMIDPGEDPLLAAHRELKEETGFSATQMIPLGAAYMAPGFTDEYMHFYLARGLSAGETDFDEDEHIETHKIPIEALQKMIGDGKIIDAKTMVAFALSTPYR
jgi:ADP-ribose pyrophosphatase